MQPVLRTAAVILAALAAGYVVGQFGARSEVELVASSEAAPVDRVFELRTYTAPEGKLEALETRFRDHTLGFFEKHGMTSIGYWKPLEEPGASNTIVYLLAHPSREAARENWAAFSADSAWREVAAASQVDGRIVSGVESLFLTPTDYSPIK
jgi:hypothetical protein